MSLLTMVNHTLDELGLPAVTSVVGSTNETARQMKSLCEADIRWLRDKYEWDSLIKERNLKLDGRESYAPPGDLDHILSDIIWNRGDNTRGRGSYPQMWQQEISYRTTPQRTRFRIRGAGTNRFLIYPAVGSPTEPDELYFYEYRSKNAIAPVEWETGKSFEAKQKCFSNGEIYYSETGGAAGATAPSHTEGTESDGNINWTYFDDVYPRFLYDDESSIIDEQIVEKGLQWRFMRVKGLPGWEDTREEYFDMISRETGKDLIGETVSLAAGRYDHRLLDEWNMPDHIDI